MTRPARIRRESLVVFRKAQISPSRAGLLVPVQFKSNRDVSNFTHATVSTLRRVTLNSTDDALGQPHLHYSAQPPTRPDRHGKVPTGTDAVDVDGQARALFCKVTWLSGRHGFAASIRRIGLPAQYAIRFSSDSS